MTQACGTCRKNLNLVASPIEENGKFFCSISCAHTTRIGSNGLKTGKKRRNGNFGLAMINRLEFVLLGRMFRFFLGFMCLSITISIWMVVGGIGYIVSEGINRTASIVTAIGIVCLTLSVILIEKYRRG